MKIEGNNYVIWSNQQNYLTTACKGKKQRLDHKKSTTIARNLETHSKVGSYPWHSTSRKAENEQKSLQTIHIQIIAKKKLQKL